MKADWIPVEKRLPEPEQEVLVALVNDLPPDMEPRNEVALGMYRPDLLDFAGRDPNYSLWQFVESGLICEVGQITHWMPLPKHPEEKP